MKLRKLLKIKEKILRKLFKNPGYDWNDTIILQFEFVKVFETWYLRLPVEIFRQHDEIFKGVELSKAPLEGYYSLGMVFIKMEEFSC